MTKRAFWLSGVVLLWLGLALIALFGGNNYVVQGGGTIPTPSPTPSEFVYLPFIDKTSPNFALDLKHPLNDLNSSKLKGE